MTSNLLKKLNFKRNWIYEVIVTTNGDGRNAAPMGIFTPDFEHICLNIYKSSETCRNILNSKIFVVNFVDDIELFYSASLDNDPGYVENSLVLSGASGYLELEVAGIDGLDGVTKVSSRIINCDSNGEIYLLNRAKFLALECLITSTKPIIAKKQILEYYRVIKKIAPDSMYETIVKNIIEDREK